MQFNPNPLANLIQGEDLMQTQLSRRTFLQLTAGSMAAVALAACAPAGAPAPAGGGAAAPAAEKVTLNVWWFDDPINMAMIKAYSDAHPSVDVNATAIGDIVFGDQKYLTAVAGGTGPDAAAQNRHTFLQFAAKGLYKDVTPWMEKSGLKSKDFAPVQITEST